MRWMVTVCRWRNRVAAFVAVALLAVVAGGGGVALGAGATSLRVEGVVKSISAGSLEIKTDAGQAMTFRLVATTVYLSGAQTVQQSDVRVGERVRVKYHQEPNGSLKAKEVKVLPSPTPLLFAEGTVSAVASDQLTVVVAGVSRVFRLTSETTYSSNGLPIQLSVFKPGVRVRVEYHADPDGSLRAKQVSLEPVACAVVRDLTVGWEVVFGHAGTGRAALALARRLIAKGFKAIVERESCRVYEVAVRVRSRQLASSTVARAGRHGLRPTLESR